MGVVARRGVALTFVSVFRLGFVPVMPGTVGSFVGVCIAVALNHTHYLRPVLLVICFVLFSLSLIALEVVLKNISCGNKLVTTKHSGKYDTDPPYVIIDEVVGQLIALAIPAASEYISLPKMLLCFAFFRLFDILKPWPIRQIEKKISQKEGLRSLGIMFDDILAGLCAGVVVKLIMMAITKFF
ncbi:MAG: phosphatidylglycerophosphatase A [Holosporales bacterium]|jgi:phosphatidylglycerophosphatase A|nr:phosphatidylglycerophosphatase A [Holosporales bacterium]